MWTRIQDKWIKNDKRESKNYLLVLVMFINVKRREKKDILEIEKKDKEEYNTYIK